MSAYEPCTVALDLSAFHESEHFSERTRIDYAQWLRNLADRDERNEPVFGVPQRRLVRWIADAIEAQTRPAITEPTGLGAVVEDADEACWVRADDLKRPWHWGDNRRAWSNLTPVRVLSEGVA